MAPTRAEFWHITYHACFRYAYFNQSHASRRAVSLGGVLEHGKNKDILDGLRLRVVPLSLSPLSETRRKAASKKWPPKILEERSFLPPGSREAIFSRGFLSRSTD